MYITDMQDNPSYWNNPDIIRDDSGNLPIGYNPAEDPMIDTIFQWAKKNNTPEDARVLEFGCGGGRILMLWNESKKKYQTGWSLSGLDHASRVIELASSRFTDRDKITFFASEIDKLLNTKLDTQYNVIFTHTALQHNSNWKLEHILSSFYHLLSTNGLLWMINEKTFASWEDGKLKNPNYSDARGSSGTAAWWISLVSSYGFELVEYYRSSYTWKKI